ncbi:hypothetical protein [Ktedonospora formicarum]|uniref:Uncharacterized protein n=1 Tax=Ktedonospora formicarum TaxID=2778364 RepID=A0A8J3IAW1_9CHLR|nr:hypothetical protein [Ktedonospora formicarum]GHO47949.1 hypothetical protein KSX_61120 [Ktedonospora formicarum]
MPKNGSNAPKKHPIRKGLKKLGLWFWDHKVLSLVFIFIPVGVLIAAMVTALTPAPRGTSETSDTSSGVVIVGTPTPDTSVEVVESPTPSVSASSAPETPTYPGSREVCFEFKIEYSVFRGEISGVDKPSMQLYDAGIKRGEQEHNSSVWNFRDNATDDVQIKTYTSGDLVTVASLSNLDIGDFNLCATVGEDSLYAVKGNAQFDGNELTDPVVSLNGPTGDNHPGKAGANLRYDYTEPLPLKGSVFLRVKDGGKGNASVELKLDALHN